MADEDLKIKKGSPEDKVKKEFIDGNPLFEVEEKVKKHLKEKLEKKKKKMKEGGMADLSGDGKITKKDVLIGRGVIKKKAKKVKKMNCGGMAIVDRNYLKGR